MLPLGSRSSLAPHDQARLRDSHGHIHLAFCVEFSKASYILIPSSAVTKGSEPRAAKPRRPNELTASISPVVFQSVSLLEMFFEIYNKNKPNLNKKDKNKNGDRSLRDTSLANYLYSYYGQSPAIRKDVPIRQLTDLLGQGALLDLNVSNSSRHRSAFEYSRLLFRWVQYGAKPDQYTLQSKLHGTGGDSGSKTPRVVFLCANPVIEKGSIGSLTLRDLSWALFDPPLGEERDALTESERYIESIYREDEFLSHWEQYQSPVAWTTVKEPEPFTRNGHEVASQEFSSDDEADDLWTNFSELCDDNAVVVCMNSLEVLRLCLPAYAHDDVASWELGISTLFDLRDKAEGPRRDRARSRSPGPSTTRRNDPPAPSHPDSSPKKCVRVLDVRSLYALSSGDESSRLTLRELGSKMGIETDTSKACAGNDVLLLYRIWAKLSGGDPIQMVKAVEGYWIPTDMLSSVSIPKSDQPSLPTPTTTGVYSDDDDDDYY